LLCLCLSEVAQSREGAILFEAGKQSRTILSYVLHICALMSIALAAAYTATALALMPFSWGAMVGAMFYLVVVLVIWD